MISTEINILDHIQLSEQDIDIITLAAKEDAIKKLMKISDDSLYEFDLEFNFELICKTNISELPTHGRADGLGFRSQHSH